MKLNNLTSLDPDEAARGVHGLRNASAKDKGVWNEFHSDPEDFAAECEVLWQHAVEGIHGNNNSVPQDFAGNRPMALNQAIAQAGGETTEAILPRKTRLAQAFFRKAVFSAYQGQCCLTRNPVSALLVASHILPWASHPNPRVDPRNGLCLSSLHDRAFDQGLITFDQDYRLVLGPELRAQLSSESLQFNFANYEGHTIELPHRFLPNQSFLEFHRERIFRE